MARTSFSSVWWIVSFFALAACGGEDASPPTVDSGWGGDAGPVLPSSCSASEEDVAETAGCNGGFLGAPVADGTFGGRCTPGDETMPAGTCSDASAQCASIDGITGICLVPCAPQETFVSESDCPTGSRCFTFDADYAVCYPDCNTDADCTAGACDDEGSCVPAADDAA